MRRQEPITGIPPCPICERAPDIDECGGNCGWYANCYAQTPFEHNVGVNGLTRGEAILNWRAEVDAVKKRLNPKLALVK